MPIQREKALSQEVLVRVDKELPATTTRCRLRPMRRGRDDASHASHGALTPSQLDHYREHGFVLVEDLLNSTTDIDPVLAECDAVLDDLANELFATGQIASTYADLGFDERLCQIYNETGQVRAQHFDISLPQGGIGPDSPSAVGPATFADLALDRVVTAEMKRGDVLFMHRRTCHSSLPNVSEQVRISFDLRYNPTGRPLFPARHAQPHRPAPPGDCHDPLGALLFPRGRKNCLQRVRWRR